MFIFDKFPDLIAGIFRFLLICPLDHFTITIWARRWPKFSWMRGCHNMPAAWRKPWYYEVQRCRPPWLKFSTGRLQTDTEMEHCQTATISNTHRCPPPLKLRHISKFRNSVSSQIEQLIQITFSELLLQNQWKFSTIPIN